MKKILIIVTITWSFFNALGQQILTLDESINKALRNSSSIKRAGLEITAAQQALDLSRRKFAPEISGQLTLQYNPIIATNILPVGQFNPQNPTDETRAVQFGLPWSNSLGITAKQTIFDPSLISEMKERKLELFDNEMIRSAERERIIDGVCRSYYQLLINEAELSFAAGDTLRARSVFQLASDRFDQNQIKEVEKRQAEYTLLTARYNFQKTLTNVKNAKATLAYHLDLPQDSIVGLGTDLRILDTDRESVINVSIFERSDFRRKQNEIALNQQQISTARSRLLPVISANAFLGANQFSRSFEVAESNLWFGNSFINLNIQVPVSGWYLHSKKIQQAKTRLQQNELELKEIRKRFDLETLTASNNLELALLQYKNQMTNLSVAKAIHADVLNNFKQGRALSGDVQKADATVRHAQYDVLKSIYDVLMNRIELQRLSGFTEKLKSQPTLITKP